jgi:hypothetical protein
MLLLSSGTPTLSGLAAQAFAPNSFQLIGRQAFFPRTLVAALHAVETHTSQTTATLCSDSGVADFGVAEPWNNTQEISKAFACESHLFWDHWAMFLTLALVLFIVALCSTNVWWNTSKGKGCLLRVAALAGGSLAGTVGLALTMMYRAYVRVQFMNGEGEADFYTLGHITPLILIATCFAAVVYVLGLWSRQIRPIIILGVLVTIISFGTLAELAVIAWASPDVPAYFSADVDVEDAILTPRQGSFCFGVRPQQYMAEMGKPMVLTIYVTDVCKQGIFKTARLSLPPGGQLFPEIVTSGLEATPLNVAPVLTRSIKYLLKDPTMDAFRKENRFCKRATRCGRVRPIPMFSGVSVWEWVVTPSRADDLMAAFRVRWEPQSNGRSRLNLPLIDFYKDASAVTDALGSGDTDVTVFSTMYDNYQFHGTYDPSTIVRQATKGTMASLAALGGIAGTLTGIVGLLSVFKPAQKK